MHPRVIRLPAGEMDRRKRHRKQKASLLQATLHPTCLVLLTVLRTTVLIFLLELNVFLLLSTATGRFRLKSL